MKPSLTNAQRDYHDYLSKINEEWIWVTGYKGTDKNMQCKNDFQYELGKRYDMPEDEKIVVCQSGFHFCRKLEDVHDYFSIGDGNRFFEVRALVRKIDFMAYGKSNFHSWFPDPVDKLAAKSIELVRELSVDEILAPYPETATWSIETKYLAIIDGFAKAKAMNKRSVLVRMGYAEPLAEYICAHRDKSGYDLAVALDAQPGISMDTKINAIFSHI